MSATGGRAWWSLLAATSLMAAACGGGEVGSPNGGGGADGSEVSGTEGESAGAPAAQNACRDDLRRRLPPAFDPATCWSIPALMDPGIVGTFHFVAPVIAGDRLFGVVPVGPASAGPGQPVGGGDPPLVVAAYDLATGAQVWTSDPLPGELQDLAAVDVEGEPGVAVLVTETDDGDAVTASSRALGCVVWSADVDEGSSGEPAVHLVGPADSEPDSTGSYPPSLGRRWTDQGLLAGDSLLLRPGADEFEPIADPAEPVMIGGVELDGSFGGVSGEGSLILSYVTDWAFPSDGPDDGNDYVGWVARDLEGATVWNRVTSSPHQGEGPDPSDAPERLPLVVGNYALTITPTGSSTDGRSTALELEWLDATSGEPAQPTPEDLAGSIPVGPMRDADGAKPALLSPDGRHLFVHWPTSAAIIDVEAGTATFVASDFDMLGTAIDETDVYARTANGAVTIDQATAEPTPIEGTTLIVYEIVGDTAILYTDWPSEYPGQSSGADELIVARHR